MILAATPSDSRYQRIREKFYLARLGIDPAIVRFLVRYTFRSTDDHRPRLCHHPFLGVGERDYRSHRSGITWREDGEWARWREKRDCGHSIHNCVHSSLENHFLIKVKYYINNIPVVSFVCVNFLLMLFTSCSTPLILCFIPRTSSCSSL